MTVAEVLRELRSNPMELLVRRWNWKSAIFSSSFRALIFFACNASAGWRAASGAMLVEFLYRALTAGFYGALTQAFRRAAPAWAANLAAMALLPAVSHSIELTVHLLHGTPKLASILASACFTMLSTLFNLYAMRRGVLVVGEGGAPVGSGLRRIPRLIAGFVACGPLALAGACRRAFAPSRSLRAPQPAG